ncbi:hypothetical protein KQX54_011599 [Cotesia glomerata]|uniref:Uncharacterized protein n=1 Tax=Cotesia glomerata TaxID=32391 RepID=A0AAV7J4R5_COTGL|nr:hypothetical protein KQX54_011599 [Cotesia glomerata]
MFFQGTNRIELQPVATFRLAAAGVRLETFATATTRDDDSQYVTHGGTLRILNPAADVLQVDVWESRKDRLDDARSITRNIGRDGSWWCSSLLSDADRIPALDGLLLLSHMKPPRNPCGG